MRALKIITGHVIYNLAYTYKFQQKTTKVIGFQLTEEAALKMTCHNDAGRNVCVYKDDTNGGTSGLNLNDPKTVKRMIVHDYALNKC